MERGFATIGLVGVWGFVSARPRRKDGAAYGPRRLLPELERIEWGGRHVFFVFDSDVIDKPEVQAAEAELARLLSGRGAIVGIARLPQLGEGKTGLDDFLVYHGKSGAAELRRLFDSARPPVIAKRRAKDAEPMALADEFAGECLAHADGWRARHWRDQFHLWDGRRYETVANGDFVKRILSWLDGRLSGARPRLARDVAECIAARLLVPANVEQPVWLRRDRDGPQEPADWIALENGILDVRAAVAGSSAPLRPHTPLWFSPNVLPYPHNPRADCPLWFTFLDEALDGDEELINLLGEWFGVCLTADTRYHAIMLLEGPRRSGKGTTLRMLSRLVGPFNCVSPRFSTLGELFGLASLVGKTVAICPDAHLGTGDRALNTLEIIKSISGEDALEIHRKHLPSIPSVRLLVRFTLAVNELPKFGDYASALLSRLLIVPYRNCFVGREDRDLDDKLAAEAPGVLNWALAGLYRLRKNKRFTAPAASGAVLSDFGRLTSPLAAFLSDCCTIAPGANVRLDDLWRSGATGARRTVTTLARRTGSRLGCVRSCRAWTRHAPGRAVGGY